MAEQDQTKPNYLILMDLSDKIDFIDEAGRFGRRPARQSLCYVKNLPRSLHGAFFVKCVDLTLNTRQSTGDISRFPQNTFHTCAAPVPARPLR